jgi:hypothetical protein
MVAFAKHEKPRLPQCSDLWLNLLMHLASVPFLIVVFGWTQPTA